jgi:hypothetical protein
MDIVDAIAQRDSARAVRLSYLRVNPHSTKPDGAGIIDTLAMQPTAPCPVR